jgi:hypothetical protein
MFADVGDWLKADYYGKDLDKQLFHTTPKLENEKKFKSSLLENSRQLYYTLNRGNKFDDNKGHYIGEGSTGDYVILIQKALNLIFKDDPTYEPLKEEKDFGEKTKAAVVKFQRDFELTGGTNGVVGPETIDELDKRVLDLEVKIAAEVETIGSKSEKIAFDIIKRHGSARSIGEDLDNGKFNLTEEENKLLFIYNSHNEIVDFTLIGNIVNDIIQHQAYLEKFNKDAADFFLDIIESGELTNSDLTDIGSARKDIVERTKLEYVMAIFNPQNVGTILFMSLGTGGNVTSTLRQKGYQFLTTRFKQFAIAEAKAMTQLGSKGITGFTTHGTSRAAIERGFTNQSILKIVKGGKVIKQTGKYGTKQLKYTLGYNSVVVELSGQNAGKIITTFSNQTVNGVRGGFVPFK